MEVLIVIIIVIGVIYFFNNTQGKARVESALEVAKEHLPTLHRKRKIKLTSNEYGNYNWEPWNKEIRFFMDDFNLFNVNRASRSEVVLIKSFIIKLDEMIDEYEDKLNDENESSIKFDKNFTPEEYEHFCAELLIDEGFDARVTKLTGDQGADIIIYNTDNQPTTVIQCKLYSRPVGNKAVQEVNSARLHYGADYAYVVTNNSYTKSAKELANTNDVMLIHHDDLKNL